MTKEQTPPSPATPATEGKRTLPDFVFSCTFAFNGAPLAGVDIAADDLPMYAETLVAIMAQCLGTMLAQSGHTGRAWEAFRTKAREDVNREIAASVQADEPVPPMPDAMEG